MADQKVGILSHQLDCTLSSKIHVGFIHNHNPIRIGGNDSLNLIQRQVTPSRRIGIGKDDSAVRLLVVTGIDFKAVGQRYSLALNVVETAIHRIKTVGNIRVQHGLTVLEKTVKDVYQHLVGAVTEENLLALHTIVIGDGAFQGLAFRVRV